MNTMQKFLTTALLVVSSYAFAHTGAEPVHLYFEILNHDGTVTRSNRLNDFPNPEKVCLEAQLLQYLGWRRVPKNRNAEISNVVIRASSIRNVPRVQFDKSKSWLRLNVLMTPDGRCLVGNFDNFNAALGN